MKLLCFSILLMVLVVTGCESPRYTQRRIATTRKQITNFSIALQKFHDDCGRYPATAEGLDALISRPVNVTSAKWHKYLDADRIPWDCWDHPYVYRCPGVHNTNSYDLYSCGADGKTRTGGDDPDDINN